MAAAAVRINNATREEQWGGSFVDVLPRNIEPYPYPYP